MASPSQTGIPDCYICRQRKASPRKSHFTPSSATEDVFGERYSEEAYSITPDIAKIEKYFGRSNSKNIDPTIRKDLTTEPYVFCKECEEKMGELEGQITPLLQRIKEDLQQGNTRYKRTALFQRYVMLPVHPRLFALYLYIIIWRQAFRQLYDGMDPVLPDEIYEQLRIAISTLIYQDSEQIIQSDLFNNLPPLVCYTSIHPDQIPEFTNPSSRETNPEVFFMGAFDCLIFKHFRISNGFRATTGIKFKVDDKGLLINDRNGSRVAVIPYKDWEEKRQSHAQDAADTFLRTAVYQLAQARRMTPRSAFAQLQHHAKQLQIETGEKYGFCFEKAFHALMGEKDKE